MAGYTKLFNSIIASTIWRESKETKIVWITLLAMANAEGRVDASVPGLADLARVSVEECAGAIMVLCAPDEWSRSKEHDGRRIQPIDGGWMILNYVKYRENRDAEIRRVQNREAQARFRDRNRVSQSKPSVSHDKPKSAQAEAEAKADAKAVPIPEPLGAAWREWIAYRAERHLAAYKPLGTKAQLTRLLEMGTERAVAAIRLSIAQNWIGIHEGRTNATAGAPAKVSREQYVAESIAQGFNPAEIL